MAFPGWAEKPKYTPKPLPQNLISPERKAEFTAAAFAHFDRLLKFSPTSKEWIAETAAHAKWMKDNGFSVTRRGLVDRRIKNEK